MTQPTSGSTASDATRTGLLFALGAYGLWGFLPAYYKITDAISADVIVAHRILWSVITVGLFLWLRGRIGEVREILSDRKALLLLGCSATLICGNWLVFIFAIIDNKVLDVSLGYFINPLVSILIGLVVLKEKLRPLQWVAVVIAALAVAVRAAGYGGLPWISLALAFSFAGYGYIRKITPVKATPGLWVETALLLPFALVYLLWAGTRGDDVTFLGSPDLLLFLVGTGVVTAMPLVFFSAAARRLPLFVMGLMQYMAPSMHFLMAVFLWGEPVDFSVLATFLMIWLALAVFSYDSLRHWRAGRAA